MNNLKSLKTENIDLEINNIDKLIFESIEQLLIITEVFYLNIF